ncbi:hypothetical protein [Pseudomonas fluorescens]|uniref:CBM6 domain-containing protein n=1 Tax=Pseudomonas fluorescens TaxID=294 RepID=A0A0F4VDI3_PSEFL|nr:hypothetical protein [Pseudomonas fluorescens]KJZ66784.1 hypothetical protein VD17_05260 [Pseudomonas fluorescens]
MSQPSSTANLLLNGEFTQEGQHWTANPSEKVRYEDGCCVLQAPGLITQDVTIASEGEFRFSVKMKSERGSACTAQVLLYPSWEVRRLDISGGTPWSAHFVDFTAPAGTHKVSIKLEANDGPFDTFGSYFDDVRLEQR